MGNAQPYYLWRGANVSHWIGWEAWITTIGIQTNGISPCATTRFETLFHRIVRVSGITDGEYKSLEFSSTTIFGSVSKMGPTSICKLGSDKSTVLIFWLALARKKSWGNNLGPGKTEQPIPKSLPSIWIGSYIPTGELAVQRDDCESAYVVSENYESFIGKRVEFALPWSKYQTFGAMVNPMGSPIPSYNSFIRRYEEAEPFLSSSRAVSFPRWIPIPPWGVGMIPPHYRAH